jgi:kynurenine formamidase
MISWPQLEPSVAQMAGGSILLVHTGWSRHWRSPAYLDHPYLGQDAAEGIVAAGVRTVAIDAMSVDETRPPGGYILYVRQSGQGSGRGPVPHRREPRTPAPTPGDPPSGGVTVTTTLYDPGSMIASRLLGLQDLYLL